MLGEWIKAGHFKVEPRLDIRRRETKNFIVVNDDLPNCPT
jgi:hypothetical protein